MKEIPENEVNNQALSLLFALNETIANISNTEFLFQTIYDKLKPVFHFEVAVIQLISEDRQFLEIFLQGVSAPEELLNFPAPRRLRIPVSEMPDFIDLETEEVQRFHLKDIPTKLKKDKEFTRIFEEVLGIQEQLICPLYHSGRNIGHLMLSTGRRGRIAEQDIPLLRQVCRVIATAVVNTISFERISQQEQKTEKILRFTSILLERQDLKGFRQILATGLQNLHPIHFLSLTGLPHQEEESGCVHFDGRVWRPVPETAIPWNPPLSFQPSEDQRVQISYFLPGELENRFSHHPEAQATLQKYQVQAGVAMRLDPGRDTPVSLFLGTSASPQADHLPNGLFEQAAPQLLLAIRALINWERIQYLQNRLQQENRALYQEISTSTQDKQMLGESPAFSQCLARARQVAPIDTTVLILGETGTGKEVLARYIHDRSQRRGKPLVRVNCASLPAPLIESELFGHERGSFTGAVERRIGKFELAQGGTILLDEIGELPLESQSKILRVLQEHELERIGGKGPIQIDVRVLAATNRNLEEEVRQGQFRADLFYRLNVFPISIPALRERREDIPLLADTFLRRFSKRFGRMLRPLTEEEEELLKSYEWPGNIRELEHLMERSAITAQGSDPNLREFRKAFVEEPIPQPEQDLAPLEEWIRSHIVEALKRTQGKVSGPDGAAALLGINAKTLDSKMRKYKIIRKVEIT